MQRTESRSWARVQSISKLEPLLIHTATRTTRRGAFPVLYYALFLVLELGDPLELGISGRLASQQACVIELAVQQMVCVTAEEEFK